MQVRLNNREGYQTAFISNTFSSTTDVYAYLSPLPNFIYLPLYPHTGE